MFCEDVRDIDGSAFDKPTRVTRRPGRPMKVAAMHLGLGSFQLAVAEVDASGGFGVVAKHKERVQLGEEVFSSGLIDEQAFDRGIEAVRRLRDSVRQHRPETVIAVASGGLGESDNCQDFLRCAAEASGFPIRILDGLEHARLMHLGTRHGLTLGRRRVLIIDVGAGSTQVVLAHHGECEFTASLKLGALRMRTEWACEDLPTNEDMLHLEKAVVGCLRPTLAHVRRLGVDSVVFSCGIARTLAYLTAADPASVMDTQPLGARGSYLSLTGLNRVARRLMTIGAVERAELTGTDPKRGDTLLPGALVLRVILEGLALDGARVASTGLREGLIADFLQHRAFQEQGQLISA